MSSLALVGLVLCLLSYPSHTLRLPKPSFRRSRTLRNQVSLHLSGAAMLGVPLSAVKGLRESRRSLNEGNRRLGGFGYGRESYA